MASRGIYRWILMTGTVLVLATSTQAAVRQRHLQKQPHVIMIIADDLGWNDVSWHNIKVLTPQLGELANSGIILNQSYVLPTCSPTRTALLTGRYPFTLGMQKGTLKPLEPRGVPLEARLLPEELKNLNYSTHAIGKWHLGFCSWDYTPTKRGFDTFYGFYNGAQDYYTHRRSERLNQDCQCFKRLSSDVDDAGLDLWNNTVPDHTKDGIYSTDLFISVAEDILRSRNPQDPMFLYMAFQSVHAPPQVPDKYMKTYRHITDSRRRTYMGMVTAMDDAVGRLVKSLKATGHYDDTIIIFSSDNGGSIKVGASNWPLRGAKAGLWEGSTRVAAFVHSPLLPNAGTISHQLIHATDWYATILKLAGGEIPDVLDGVDQWSALTGRLSEARTKMVYNIDDTVSFKVAIRINHFKMAIGPTGNDDWISTNNKRLMNRDSFQTTPFQLFSAHERNRSIHNLYKILFKDEKSEFKDLNNEEKEIEGTSWEEVKSHPLLDLDNATIITLDLYMKNTDKIRLHNVKDDPEERNELTVTEHIKELGPILRYLSQELPRYVREKDRRRVAEGHPSQWNNVWSPGWCEAI